MILSFVVALTHSVQELLFKLISHVYLLFGKETAVNVIVFFSQVENLLAAIKALLGGQPLTWAKCPDFALVLTICFHIFIGG